MWHFDGTLATVESFAMLQKLKNADNQEDVEDAPGGQIVQREKETPIIVVAAAADCVGITFWKRCFVLMTYKPT